MARHAARIAVNRTERLVSTLPVEAGRLNTHRIDVGAHRTEAASLVLDLFDQPRSSAFAAESLVDPEQLDEQHRHPDFADDPADDLFLFTERNGEAAVVLLPHLLFVVADEAAENRALGLADRTLDGNRRHRFQLSATLTEDSASSALKQR